MATLDILATWTACKAEKMTCLGLRGWSLGFRVKESEKVLCRLLSFKEKAICDSTLVSGRVYTLCISPYIPIYPPL